MGSSMRAVVLLGLLVATMCVAAEATTPKPTTAAALLDVKVALQLSLKKCSSDVKVYVGVNAKAVTCAGGALTILKPVLVHLQVPYLLYVDVEIVGSAKVKVRVVVDLRKVGKLVGGVHHIVLDLVEDKKRKTVNVLCLGVLLKSLSLGINVGVGIHV